MLAYLRLRENPLGAVWAVALLAASRQSFNRNPCPLRRGGLLLHLFPKLQRIGDQIEPFMGAASARDDDRAVAKESPAEPLLDTDAF